MNLLSEMAKTLQIKRKVKTKKHHHKPKTTMADAEENTTTNTNKKDFSEKELTDLRTAFDLLDRNSDGQVTVNELQFMLQNLGIELRDEYVQDLIKEATQTGSVLMNETEFLHWIARIQALRQEEDEDEDDCTKDLIAAFRVFDRDRNGYITKDELQSAMEMIGERLTDQQLTDLLTIADVDKDGKINYEEFARLLQ